MGKILCIETSTEVCSVALVENGVLVDFREDLDGRNHSKLLTVFINELLEANHIKATDLSAVAVSEGPGSYTGLRIGVSVAKGICYATAIPMIAVCPLQSMAYAVVSDLEKLGFVKKTTDLFAPMIDARRMEVYTGIFDANYEKQKPIEALVVDEHAFAEPLANSRVFYFGNGAAKCQSVLTNPNAIFIDGITTSARHTAQLSWLKFEKNEFVDVAYFEPYYLKDFIATVPKNYLNTSV
jgi:tRNA threonylcarbamoyladenosine biosynthesis protein TsaB